MAIPKNYQKVIDLTAYRQKRVTYAYNPEPEFIFPGELEDLIRQGRYCGTYTPPVPYGHMDEGKEDT